MVQQAHSPQGSSSPTKQDLRRERELLKFYKPSDYTTDTLRVSPVSPSDVHLAALAQLVTLRLDVNRSLINLIGRDNQYTVVEEKQRGERHLSEGTIADEAWLGNGGVIPKKLSLCETAILQKETPGQHNILIIPDLTKDPRFCDRPYVTGGTKQRFYAGVPLKTKRGVAIGALCVIDHKPRHGLTDEEQGFMVHMAASVVDYLEMRKLVDENSRATRMASGMNSLMLANGIGNKSEVFARRKKVAKPVACVCEEMMEEVSQTVLETSEGQQQLPLDSSIKDGPMPMEDNKRMEKKGSTNDSRLQTLFRAALLLQESLDLVDAGGVVFYDNLVGIMDRPRHALGQTNGSQVDGIAETSDSNSDDHETLGSSRKHQPRRTKATILAHSVSGEEEDQPPKVLTHPLSANFLKKLLKRYPNGQTWQFDETGVLSSTEDDGNSEAISSRKIRKTSRVEVEAKQLQQYFPGVQSLILVPLWDPVALKYFTGCIAYTTSIQREFEQSEFNYVKAFGNSIGVELGRLAALDADRRKSDFIGSISHELRSPLHGLLASAEFLAETECDDFQRQLVDTVRISGRSFLDVIDHVLDFSKITSLERAWKSKSNGQPDDSAAENFASGVGTRSVDLAILAEEVIESVHAGRMSANFSQDEVVSTLGLERTKSQIQSDSVTTILDIEPGEYTFTTQPGALRRVIMNLYNNACKYTTNGTITVRLSVQESTEVHTTNDKRNVVLEFLDTGKGMSKDYLLNHLYRPFTQENDLSPGTGLGLSIVRSIINMLDGSISITSERGQGTQVRVCVPFDRPRSSENTIIARFQEIKEIREHKSVGLFGFNLENGHAASEVGKTLKKYIEGWYGFRCLQTWSTSTSPDIVVVEEANLGELQATGLAPSTGIIVLSATPSPQKLKQSHQEATQFLLKPFGPSKLAKSIQKSLELLQLRRSGENGHKALNEDATNHYSNNEDTMSTKATSSSISSPATLTPPIPLSPSLHNKFTSTPHSKAPPTTTTTLPTHTKPREPISPSNSIQPTPTTPTTTKPRILLVDDNNINLMLLSAFTKRRKLPSDRATNGAEALHLATSTAYDVILMDISMPIMDGFEATREIRRMEKQKQRNGDKGALIVALTGLGGARDRSEAEASGFDRYLTKPVDFKELGGMLDAWESLRGKEVGEQGHAEGGAKEEVVKSV